MGTSERNQGASVTEQGLSRQRLDALLLDLDGVLTRAHELHAAAFRSVVEDYLHAVEQRTGQGVRAFDIERDSVEHLEGKPCLEGLASLLRSRGIDLATGAPEDEPGTETLWGLGNRKNDRWLELIGDRGAGVYADAPGFLQRARNAGLAVAVVSSSAHGDRVLRAAGLDALVDLCLDSQDLAERNLPGRPDPAVLRAAAQRLGVAQARCAVLEEVPAGIRASRAAGFGCTIGIDRRDRGSALREAGAGAVLADLDSLEIMPDEVPATAKAVAARVDHALGAREAALLLDYDGTLTPIVDHPGQALLDDTVRECLRRLARKWTVAVISGRERAELADLVGLQGLYYAGSHGFEISGPGGLLMAHPDGRRAEPELRAAAAELERELAGIEGSLVEDKRYAVAVHYRLVADAEVPAVEAAVDEALNNHPGLLRTGGKKVFELRPAQDWHKGRAVLWLLQALGLEISRAMPIYIGDDETDEDAFAALADRGVGIRVSGQPCETRALLRLASPSAVAELLELLGKR